MLLTLVSVSNCVEQYRELVLARVHSLNISIDKSSTSAAMNTWLLELVLVWDSIPLFSFSFPLGPEAMYLNCIKFDTSKRDTASDTTGSRFEALLGRKHAGETGFIVAVMVVGKPDADDINDVYKGKDGRLSCCFVSLVVDIMVMFEFHYPWYCLLVCYVAELPTNDDQFY